MTNKNSKLRDLPITIEDIEDETNDHSSLREERIQREPLQHDKIQYFSQTNELEKSLNRTGQERLSKSNLIHSERTRFLILSYKYFKMKDSDPLVIPSLSFDVERVIAPQQSKPIDVDIEDAYTITPIYEHRERIHKPNNVPIQQIIDTICNSTSYQQDTHPTYHRRRLSIHKRQSIYQSYYTKCS